MTIAQLDSAIINLVNAHKGIKASLLCAKLSVEFVALDKLRIRQSIINLIRQHQIIEIEYLLPDGKNESLLLPCGSKYLGRSQ